jgi:hypothetical protein
MIRRSSILCLSFALVICAPGAVSQAVASNALARKSGDDLVCQVLAACGTTACESSRALDRFAAFRRQLTLSDRVMGSTQRRARLIHEFVHAEILRGKFDPAGSDLAVALAGGPFNCASASALFLALATDFGVEAQAISVTGHVWCRVTENDYAFDVETTSRQWFTIARQNAAGGPGAASTAWHEHLRRSRAGRVLDGTAFLAIFHFNRGVSLLRGGKFGDASLANLRAIALDPRCRPAWENLLCGVQAWSQSWTELASTRYLRQSLPTTAAAEAGRFSP